RRTSPTPRSARSAARRCRRPMRPSHVALLFALAAPPTWAQDAGPKPKAKDAGALDDEASSAKPNPHGANPHGGGGGMMPGMSNAPPDTVEEDPTLPPGTIAATILDADDRPLSHTMVTVGVLRTSVAKGDSRAHIVRETDDNG